MSEEQNVLQPESSETEKPEVYKFPLPDGRTVEMSSDMSGADQMCAFQQIINAYSPMPSLLDPKDEALAWTKAYMKRMKELHCLTVIGCAEPAESEEAFSLPVERWINYEANLEPSDPRFYPAFLRMAENIVNVLLTHQYRKSPQA